jgi:site-specific DNA-methyltransferase (adenine-specific)
MSLVVRADNLDVLGLVPDGAVDLVYIDPPFNTGRTQARPPLRTVRDEAGGDRTGFGGRRYRTERAGPSRSFEDTFDDYLGFLEPRLREAHRVLAPTGCFYLHLDYREVHYAKVLADRIFGRDAFINEIVWAYDYGARTRRRWPAKHDDILFYARDPARYFFDAEAVDRIPYMAPDLVGPEKAARGKLPTDTWWHTIVSPTGKEKLGYPTQKPLGILRRIVSASCPPGGVVLDFFAGSGTTGAAARELGRRFLLVDSSAEAMAVMRRRFADMADVALLELGDAAGGGEAGLEIRAQIARVLETDREPDETVADPQGPPRLGR